LGVFFRNLSVSQLRELLDEVDAFFRDIPGLVGREEGDARTKIVNWMNSLPEDDDDAGFDTDLAGEMGQWLSAYIR
jgi:hypothetical protein